MKRKGITVKKLKEKLEKLIKLGYGDKTVTIDIDQYLVFGDYVEDEDCVILEGE